MKKLGVYTLIFTLVFSMMPIKPIAAFEEEADSEFLDGEINSELMEEQVVLFSETKDKGVGLYESSEAEQPILLIPDYTEVTLLFFENIKDPAYSLIRYTYADGHGKEEIIEGFVDSSSVVPIEEADQFKQEREAQMDNESEDEKDSEETSENYEDEKVITEKSVEENESSFSDDSNFGEKVEDDDQSKLSSVEEQPNVQNNSFSKVIEPMQEIQETKTSRLGHIRNANVKIYEKINGKSFTAGSTYTHAVYYIKRQAKVGSETYYLISTEPSSVNGVVGWVKAADLSTHPHVGVDKKKKTFYINGKGKATTKAWGGNKDTVYSSMAKYKGQSFEVHLTEKVGNNTWYRGKINGTGPTVWLHSSYIDNIEESYVSRLGHIRNANVKIYEKINGKSFTAGSTYTHAVYYIKKQAKVGSETYYLISTEPSSVKGVVGWVKAADLSTHPHVGVDKKKKTFYINGKGKATTKAWGGNKDTVYSSMVKYKGQSFEVHLTEKVGNNTWYRGKINGKGPTVWLHSSFVTDRFESNTSRLGHIRNANVKIYEKINGKSFTAGSTYTHAVYYIKRQAKVGSETYYLISTEPSSVKGVVGWVKAADLSTHPHVSVDKKKKTFYINGKGKATTKAWGGNKDTVYSSMTNYKGQLFQVHLTEKVGNNTWYRGKINGKGPTVWLHSSYLSTQSKVVVIDAGHGGKDPGASGNGIVEKNLVLDISSLTKKLLENAGYNVIMTRTTDEFLELSQRASIANNSNADIFVSIHGNSFNGSAKGIETYWYDKYESKKSEELAKSIQQELISETKSSNRGVKKGNFHVIRETKVPSALVEVGFIDNKDEAKKLKQSSYKENVAIGIVNGIKKYFQVYH